MNNSRDALCREMNERNAAALKLFDEAKRLQRKVAELPVFKRKFVMNQVNALEQEAVREAQISLALEKQLSLPNREQI